MPTDFDTARFLRDVPSVAAQLRFRFVLSASRGDVDDRVLPEAILPLLQALSTTADVRPVLHRRFDMPRWFLSQVSPSLSARFPRGPNPF